MKTKLSAPWVTYYRKIEALFGEDPEVTVKYDEDKNVIKLLVDNDEKAEAIAQLLPAEKTFGGVTIKIQVVTSNSFKEANAGVFRKAFAGNPAVSFIETIDDVFSNSVTYVVFINKVVQFFDDDLGSIFGLRSTLYEEIADDIFADHVGICFCTDKPASGVF